MRHGAQQAAVNQSRNDNYKILVVDDEEGILDSLSIFLKRSGYQFVGITDPVEAIERVKQEHFISIRLYNDTTSWRSSCRRNKKIQ